MIKAERHDRIMAEIARRGAVGVQELSDLLGASSATVRRDIAELDASSALVRTHGGAALRDPRREASYDAKVMAYLPEKRRIGAHAASLLQPEMTVGCGGGTTVMQMIRSLKRLPLHIVTTAVNLVLEIRWGSPTRWWRFRRARYASMRASPAWVRVRATRRWRYSSLPPTARAGISAANCSR